MQQLQTTYGRIIVGCPEELLIHHIIGQSLDPLLLRQEHTMSTAIEMHLIDGIEQHIRIVNQLLLIVVANGNHIAHQCHIRYQLNWPVFVGMIRHMDALDVATIRE